VTDGYTNSVTASVSVTVRRAQTGLSLISSLIPSPVIQDSNVTVTLTVTNGGPDGASDVVLNSTLTGGLSLVSATVSQGTGAKDVRLVEALSGSVTNDLTVVGYELGDLPAGSNVTVTAVVEAKNSGLLTNTVTVSAEEIDPNPADNVAAVVARVVPTVDLAVRRESGAETAWLGREMTLVWTVSNQGPSDATEVRLED